MADETGYRRDKHQVRAAFEKAADGYDEVAVLQREVGERLVERLDVMHLAPETVVEVGCGTGTCTAALAGRYPDARLVALDLATAMVGKTRERLAGRGGRGAALVRSLLGRTRPAPGFVCGDAEALPLADGCADLVVSNLTLQWVDDLAGTCREFRRILRPGGLLLFSTFGPDTLKELRAAWGAADDRVHVNRFTDLHDVGDALVRAGLAEPVMEREDLVLTYRDARGLMRDLKGIGAHNVNAGRGRGMTGKSRLRAMLEAYEGFRRDGVLPATYEVIYGHGWVPESSTAPDEARVPVTGIGGRRTG